MVRSRIDSDTKARATAALDAMGLLMFRIADEQRLPFSVQVPNAKTVKAMDELKAGQGKRFNNEQDLFDDLKL